MPRSVYDEPPGFDGDFGEDLDGPIDPEGPSLADIERFGDEVNSCPECGSEVYEQAPLCHVCGHAFESPSSKAPPWAMIVAAIAVLAILLVFVF